MGIAAIIQDTLRECMAKKIILLFLLIGTIGIFGLYLLLDLDILENGVVLSFIFDTNDAEFMSLNQFNDVVKKVLSVLAVSLVNIVFFLSVFATADLIPSLMTKGRLDLYLARPVSRARLLIGKYLGALSVVALNIIYIIFGLWLVIGIKTGIWDFNFLYTSAGTLFMFAAFYPFIIITGLYFKNTPIILIVALMIYTLSQPLAFREFGIAFFNNKLFEYPVEALYWILPKSYELSFLVIRNLAEGSAVESWTPVTSTIISTLGIFMVGIFFFSRKNC